ncbi:MAG: ABC transporter permease [Anaerolineae bacterium]|nr:ABC transporter permease [Anaerolineae bacterium]MDW8098692.1 ABC transporter permease [Anaerolineae bacterium]
MRTLNQRGLFSWILSAREIGLLGFLVVLIIAVSLRSPYFLTVENLRDILLDIAILSIVAIGQTMVIITRGIDLSVASNLALSGMVVGMTVSSNWDLPPLLALVMGMGIGLVLGAFNGLIVTRGNVPPIIATLGTLSIYRGLVFAISGGAWVDAAEMPESFKLLARGSILGIPNLVFIAALVALIFYYFLNHTRTGREIYAVGSNPLAAQVVGIRVHRIVFLVFLLSGLLAGMGGVLWVSRYASAQSDSAVGFELQTVAASVVGGVNIFGGSGTIPGVLLGSLLLGVIINALNLVRISPFWKLAVQGLVILLAVISDALVSRQLQRAALLRRGT